MSGFCDKIARGNDIYVSCKSPSGQFEDFKVINQGTLQLVCKTDTEALADLVNRVTIIEGDINSLEVQYSDLLSIVNRNLTDYRDLNNMPLIRTAQLVQKADFEALQRAVEVVQQGTFSLKNCSGANISRGGMVPDCAEFNNLTAEVESLERTINILQQQITNGGGNVTDLVQRVTVLETQMQGVLDRLSALETLVNNNHQEVIRRLEALENNQNPGGGNGISAESIRWKATPIPATTDVRNYGFTQARYRRDISEGVPGTLTHKPTSLNVLEMKVDGQWREVPFFNNTQAAEPIGSNL